MKSRWPAPGTGTNFFGSGAAANKAWPCQNGTIVSAVPWMIILGAETRPIRAMFGNGSCGNRRTRVIMRAAEDRPFPSRERLQKPLLLRFVERALDSPRYLC